MASVAGSAMDWLKRNRLWLVLLGLAALLGYTHWSDAQRVPATEEQLSNVESVDELRSRFNQDAGHPRLKLHLSPT